MGEYARLKSSGESVKIGTCEDMYYLRADQATQVWPEHGNVDPVKDRDALRFRFPFPDEDTIPPGSFDDPWKALKIWGLDAPAEIDHDTVQFRADNGYLCSLPCPESGAYDDQGVARMFWEGQKALRVGKNGYGGAVELVQQRYWNGLLVGVCRCRGCGAKYRLETLEMAEEAAVLIRSAGDREIQTAEANGTEGNRVIGERYHEIARRLLAGYEVAS